MHNLHFTVSSKDDDMTPQDYFDSIESEVQEYFSERTHWDWFEVIGYIDIEANKLHLKKDNDYRFSHIIDCCNGDWDLYLGKMLKDKILSVKYPTYSDHIRYYYEIKDYANYIRDIKYVCNELVTGPIEKVVINHQLLPYKLTDYAGFMGFKFDQFGVTDISLERGYPAIVGLIDVHS